MTFYKRCPRCRGTGLHDGEPCEKCDGHGGWWVVTGGPGISVEVIPGDADQKPEGCNE